MRFSVARDVLSEAASWTVRALPLRPATPILAGIRLNAHGEELSLSSFDYEVSAHAAVPAQVDEDGEALVLGRLLSDISKSLPDRPVKIAVEGAKADLTCGSSHFSLATLPLDEYPDLPKVPESAGSVDAPVFAQAIGQVVVAASRDETLPLLTTVRIEIDGEHVTLLSTDRYRLALREFSWQPRDPGVHAGVLVKARILSDVAKSMTAGEHVDLAISHSGAPGQPALIAFSAGGRQTTSTLMDGDYPPVRRLFPDSTTIHAVCEREALLESVKRVSLVAERKTSVRLSFTQGQVVLSAGQGDNAQASEAVQAHLDGDDLNTAFNPQFLIDGLNAVDQDYVRFSFTHPSKPAVLTGQKEPTGESVDYFRYLLMPIRFDI